MADELNAHMPLVYQRLRAAAARYLDADLASRTLQPTALVHEAYLKLARIDDAPWNDREHFFAIAANALRQVLVDHTRRRAARGGHLGERVTLSGVSSGDQDHAVDLIALDAAIDELSRLDPRQARLVELRFFAGFTNAEAARCLDVSISTVEAEWRRARAWMSRAIDGTSQA